VLNIFFHIRLKVITAECVSTEVNNTPKYSKWC